MPNILSKREVNCSCSELLKLLSSYNNKNKMWSQFFSLGIVLLNSAIGGLEVDSINLFKNVLIDKTFNLSEICCLYHLLIKLEEEYISNKKTLLLISNLIKNKFTDNFTDFLCKTLSFHYMDSSDNKRITVSINSHKWIKVNNYIYLNNKLSKIRVSIKEIIKVIREGKKLRNNNIEIISHERKLFNFLANFEIIFANTSKVVNLEEYSNLIQTKKSTLKELSYVMNINTHDLFNYLTKTINKK
jgi:hypothetical protein